MSATVAAVTANVSDAERALLRKSVRDFLVRHWPADTAVERAGNAEAVASLWRGMADQGLASLGSDPAEAGLREILLAFEELGRASCPAPLLGAVAANLVLTNRATGTSLPDALNQGRAAVAVAFGGFDGDAAAGRVEWQGDAISGTVAFVEGVQAATHLLVCTASGAAIVARDAAGLRIEETPGLAVPPLCTLMFSSTPAQRIEASASSLSDAALVARLACASRAHGAARRGFELAVENAKVRKQFGQLIGQFQALQHKLANNLIALDGVRLALESAADARDRGDGEWPVFANAALAFVGPALREVTIQTHRALGAIGYAEEHEAPRHFRRVHSDVVRFGGVSRARAALADHLLGLAN